MRKSTLITLLLLSAAAAVTPASANWFSRPAAGIALNVGSAPNPTPNDLRALYGPARYGLYRVTGSISAADMEGKPVFGQSGEELGTVMAVDERAGLVQVSLHSGESVALDSRLFITEPDRVVAPTLSIDEVMALAIG